LSVLLGVLDKQWSDGAARTTPGGGEVNDHLKGCTSWQSSMLDAVELLYINCAIRRKRHEQQLNYGWIRQHGHRSGVALANPHIIHVPYHKIQHNKRTNQLHPRKGTEMVYRTMDLEFYPISTWLACRSQLQPILPPYPWVHQISTWHHKFITEDMTAKLSPNLNWNNPWVYQISTWHHKFISEDICNC
jgi:hypothetical protein